MTPEEAEAVHRGRFTFENDRAERRAAGLAALEVPEVPEAPAGADPGPGAKAEVQAPAAAPAAAVPRRASGG